MSTKLAASLLPNRAPCLPPSGKVKVPEFFWADDKEWQEAQDTLAYLFVRYDSAWERVRQLARQTRDNLDPLFAYFDEFTARVCPDCRAVCCREARVAFDFKDLLFIHALDLTPPPHQLRRHHREPCRYLGPEGCRLPRILRPFICTWFYCAPMLELFRQQPARVQRDLSFRMALVQRNRVLLEDEFIWVVTPEPT